MSGFLKGAGLLGAGAWGYHHVASDDRLRSLLPRLPYLSDTFSSSSSDNSQVRALKGEVERLSGLLTESMRRREYTVIHGQRSSVMFWVYAVACLGGVGLYCKWRGLSLMDLLFVSQGALQQFKQSVSQGLGKLWEELRKQKDEMMKKLTSVSTRQDQMMDNQQQMDERLKQVGENVDDVKVNTHRISSRVSILDSRLAEVAHGVSQVQQGVLLLCHTVAEVTQRIGMPQNTRSQQALKGFLGGAGLSGGSIASGQQLMPLPGLEPSSFIEKDGAVTVAHVMTGKEQVGGEEDAKGRSFSAPTGPPSFLNTKPPWSSVGSGSEKDLGPIWSIFAGRS